MCQIPRSNEQIQSALDKLNLSLSNTGTSQQKWLCLWVARWAIDWMMSPDVESPYNAIMSGRVEHAAWLHQQMVEKIEEKRLKLR